MNAVLCGTGHNLRKIHRKLRPFYALRGFKIYHLIKLLLVPTMPAPITTSHIHSRSSTDRW